MALFDIFKKKTEQAVKRTKEAWFGKIASLFDRQTIDKGLWDELEELLIAADTGVDTTEKLIGRVKERVNKQRISDAQQVRTVLMEEMTLILQVDGSKPALPAFPRVVLVVGVNGSGKTTSIAKLGHIYKRDGSKVMLAAADTFRAAAIEQLKWWGDRIGAEVIAHQPGADPGAVVFDAIQAAKTRGAQTVIVDTAGRLQTKFNLMEELKKIKRVVQRVDPTAPHETLLVLDANTGQNGVSQAKYFTEAVGITGIILTKLDSTAKGGIVLAICDQLKIPVRFIGTGETVEDLAPFDPKSFVEAIMS
ncbi:MAG TPA: signal recognition particle-docking protein FtsY [Dehalococcoidia bacterium]|nr:signal recognition particle-docking protein FtsY [Dehalococcoidia bacterium]